MCFDLTKLKESKATRHQKPVDDEASMNLPEELVRHAQVLVGGRRVHRTDPSSEPDLPRQKRSLRQDNDDRADTPGDL